MTPIPALLLSSALAIIGALIQPERYRHECLHAFPLFAIAGYLFEASAHVFGTHGGASLAVAIGAIAFVTAIRSWPTTLPAALGVLLATADGVLSAEHSSGYAIVITSVASTAWWLRRRTGCQH